MFKYLDHRDGQNKTKTLTKEDMILRFVSRIPRHHFKMVRYYSFLSNRKTSSGVFSLRKEEYESSRACSRIPFCRMQTR